MNPIFDSHAHYFDGRFARETEAGADALLTELFESGRIAGIVNIGTNPNTSRAAVAQAARFPTMYAAVGIHPEDCHLLGTLDDALSDLRALLGTPETRRRDKIVALGEIGLDYHWQFYGDIPMDKVRQAAFFEAQLVLAEELELPVIIHDREAHGDCFETILRHPRVRGVFHSYGGSREMARELCRRGWYISFSGTVTFKNADRVREVASSIPHDRLLIETDAPYLAPHPMRGKLNHSGYLSYVTKAIADLWGTDADTVAAVTSENAKRLFCIDGFVQD